MSGAWLCGGTHLDFGRAQGAVTKTAKDRQIRVGCEEAQGYSRCACPSEGQVGEPERDQGAELGRAELGKADV